MNIGARQEEKQNHLTLSPGEGVKKLMLDFPSPLFSLRLRSIGQDLFPGLEYFDKQRKFRIYSGNGSLSWNSSPEKKLGKSLERAESEINHGPKFHPTFPDIPPETPRRPARAAQRSRHFSNRKLYDPCLVLFSLFATVKFQIRSLSSPPPSLPSIRKTVFACPVLRMEEKYSLIFSIPKVWLQPAFFLLEILHFLHGHTCRRAIEASYSKLWHSLFRPRLPTKRDQSEGKLTLQLSNQLDSLWPSTRDMSKKVLSPENERKAKHQSFFSNIQHWFWTTQCVLEDPNRSANNTVRRGCRVIKSFQWVKISEGKRDRRRK